MPASKAAAGDAELMEVDDSLPARTQRKALNALKDSIREELPNMEPKYIAKIVLNAEYRSIVLRKGERVIGGITYRPFMQQKFGEIVFCVVREEEKGKGHGTKLMEGMKRIAARDGLGHLFTYGDNTALGFFEKHEFSKEITMHRDLWEGRVGVYDAATPMEYCLQDVPRSAVEVASSTRRMQTRMQARVKRALEPNAESGSTEGVVGARGQHKRARLSEEVDQDSTDGEPTEEELPARSRRKRIRGSNAVNGSADGEARTRSQHTRARAVETEEETEEESDEVLPRSRGNKRTRRSAEHRGVVDPTDSGQTRSTAGPSRRYNLRPRR